MSHSCRSQVAQLKDRRGGCTLMNCGIQSQCCGQVALLKPVPLDTLCRVGLSPETRFILLRLDTIKVCHPVKLSFSCKHLRASRTETASTPVKPVHVSALVPSRPSTYWEGQGLASPSGSWFFQALFSPTWLSIHSRSCLRYHSNLRFFFLICLRRNTSSLRLSEG